MNRTVAVVLCFLVSLNCSQAVEREYVISNLSRLLDSYSSVDFRSGTDQVIDPIKYDCAIKVNNFNIQQSNTLKDLFTKFQQGKISEDKLLRNVLDMRFRNLNFFQRHKGFKFDMRKSPLGSMHLGPGSSIMCGKLTIEGGFNLIGDDYVKYMTGDEDGGVLLRFLPKIEQKTYDMLGNAFKNYETITDPNVRDIFSPLINDNLYILNQMILGIYSLRGPHYFSDDTYEYIKASPSLWPLLEKVAQGADPFLLDDDLSIFENRDLLKEYEMYAVCVLQIASFRKEPLKGLGCKPDRDYVLPFGTLMDSGVILGKWSLPKLPTTLDKMKSRVADVISYDSKIEASKEKITQPTLKNIQKNAQRKQKANPKSKNILKMPIAKDMATETNATSSDQATSSSTVIPLGKLPNAPLLVPESNLEPKEQEPISDAESFIDETEGADFMDVTTSDQPDDFTSAFHYQPKTAPTTSENLSVAPAAPAHVFASWNRKLHSRRNTEDIPLRTDPVSTPQLKVLADIFDRETKITYGVFESLWHHLNGPKSIKSSHKRSHRGLLNPQGKVVGGTFALHGAKHQYSPGNKKELQDALTLIGCGQSYLSSLGMS